MTPVLSNQLLKAIIFTARQLAFVQPEGFIFLLIAPGYDKLLNPKFKPEMSTLLNQCEESANLHIL